MTKQQLTERLAKLRVEFERYPAISTPREFSIEETARRALVLAEDAIRGVPDEPTPPRAEAISLDTASADPLACLHPVVMGDDGTDKKWCYTCGATL